MWIGSVKNPLKETDLKLQSFLENRVETFSINRYTKQKKYKTKLIPGLWLCARQSGSPLKLKAPQPMDIP